MTYVVSQTLSVAGDALVTNTNGGTSLSAIVTGTNSGATVLIEGSNDGSSFTTLNTITAAGSYPVAFGTFPIVRARLSVAGSGSFLVALSEVLASASVSIAGQLSAVALTPTITASSAYVAGNEVGGKLQFTNVFGPAFTGTLSDIIVRCKSVQTTVYSLYLFSQNPSNTTWTNKTAPSINAADIPFLLGVWTVGASDSGLGTETTNQLNNINAAIHSVNQDLYGVLVCSATPTYTSTSDVTVSVRVRRD